MRMIPYDKLSKKARRERNLIRRDSWNELCPVTRRKDSGKNYSRAKMKSETRKFDQM